MELLNALKESCQIVSNLQGENIYYQNEQLREYVALLATALQTYSSYYKEVLTNDVISNMCNACLLHDIGKSEVPQSILLKESKLTYDEFEIIKMHVPYGIKILENMKSYFVTTKEELYSTIYNMIAAHHEWWDGTGYPCKLSREQIPIEGRILAVADVYDALRSERVYKLSFSHEKAKRIILEEKGTHFDPEIVDAFIEKEKLFEIISSKKHQDNCRF